MASLKEKVALITGASSGIGAAVARHFASLGCYVSLTGRNEERLNGVGKDCQQWGLQADQILLQTGEMSSDADLERIVHGTVERFGRLDVLVNNAGIAKIRNLERSTMEMFDTTMDVNVRAVFYLTQLASPHLIKTKGAIVNVSSVVSKVPSCNTFYSMSKYMVDQLTTNAAVELAPYGVQVNSVCPGIIHTPIFERGGMKWEKVFETSKRQHPLSRPGEDTEVASAIAFLASDNAASITGHHLPIDGGRHCMPGSPIDAT
ncbi:3-oxoacyl-[acyl-carrier-protein] reductase FabG-like [Anneissia japonica]|uniref:3-oxoacyl-[acyl-carrier-protein] reductase FabG-like n=1 Tax=Anneissia japonica TaxID=1529436 RepID=UPI00142577D1|nr:3-oxoacyl-[acyl-carrier-protein] reductase FabG-like [Anneissia japonica]